MLKLHAVAKSTIGQIEVHKLSKKHKEHELEKTTIAKTRHNISEQQIRNFSEQSIAISHTYFKSHVIVKSECDMICIKLVPAATMVITPFENNGRG